MRLRHVSLPGDAGICKRYSPPPPPPRRGFGEEDDGAGKCGWHANYVSGVLDDDDDEAARIVSLDGIQLSRGSRGGESIESRPASRLPIDICR